MSQPSQSLNQVVLVGRVSAAPESRELPSGDTVVSFRVVVDRPPARASKETPRRQVDVIDVACWSRRTQRSAGALDADTEVRVEGALRRRFFSAGGARASRYEVEAERIARVSVARAAKASSGG
jgi:single-strand DNA-binding protein